MSEQALFCGDIVNTSRIIYTPTEFEKKSLLYMQEIGTLRAVKPHISRRENLSSYLFFIVRSGSGKLSYNGKIYDLKEGSCVFIDCRNSYSHETVDNLWSLSWIHFNGSSMKDIYSRFADYSQPSFSSVHFNNYESILTNLYKIASSSSIARDVEINANLSLLLSLLLTDTTDKNDMQQGTKKATMSDIRKYLQDNCSKKITLDSLAERFFINKYYLTRSFKDKYGISIMDYLLEVRIIEAKNALRFTDMTAEEIGVKYGIGDIYYFSRIFKRIEGISIREYRRQWK